MIGPRSFRICNTIIIGIADTDVNDRVQPTNGAQLGN